MLDCIHTYTHTPSKSGHSREVSTFGREFQKRKRSRVWGKGLGFSDRLPNNPMDWKLRKGRGCARLAEFQCSTLHRVSPLKCLWVNVQGGKKERASLKVRDDFFLRKMVIISLKKRAWWGERYKQHGTVDGEPLVLILFIPPDDEHDLQEEESGAGPCGGMSCVLGGHWVGRGAPRLQKAPSSSHRAH